MPHQGRFAIDLSLFAGIFLILLSLGTFSWLLLGSIFLICGSLAYIKFGLKEDGYKIPSRNLLIDFMFVIGFFLFIAGESIYNTPPFGCCGNLVEFDTQYAYIYVGFALLASSLFLWNKERIRDNRAGLAFEVMSSLCISLILLDVFVFSYGGIRFLFMDGMPFGAFVVLAGFIIALIMSVSGLLHARKKGIVNLEGILNFTNVAQKPTGQRRISIYTIVVILAVPVFFMLPIIPMNNGCMQGVLSPVTYLSQEGGCWSGGTNVPVIQNAGSGFNATTGTLYFTLNNPDGQGRLFRQ